jgi:hypothetical protein
LIMHLLILKLRYLMTFLWQRLEKTNIMMKKKL